MPLTAVSSFFPETDLHVMRGQLAISLSTLLQVSWETTPGNDGFGSLQDYLNLATTPAPPDVEVEFRPTFSAVDTGSAFEGSGISIKKTDGDLSWLLAPAPHNFIVEAIVTRNDGGTAPTTFSTFRLRIHVHGSVTQIWLTPNQLSLRRATATGTEDQTPQRFTVRAQFDDGTVGDITDSDRISAGPGSADFFHAGLFLRIPPAIGPSDTPNDISIVTSGDWNNRSATGKIKVLEPWTTEPNVPQAEVIEGHAGVLDGTVPAEKVPNLLFLPSGFTKDELGYFEEVTNTVVHHLRTDSKLRPYPYITPAMNFWRLPLEADESGVCVRLEVYPFSKDGQLFTLPVPLPSPPPATGTWKINHLIYAAGLPVPADKIGNISIADLRHRWGLELRAAFAANVQNPSIVPDAVVEAWQKCAERSFIDEVDNFPAIAIGDPPSASSEDDMGIFGFHPLRGGNMVDVEQNPARRALFEVVNARPRNGATLGLAAADAQATNIGRLWAEIRDTYAFDQRVFVMTVCNMAVGHIRFGRGAWHSLDGLIVRPTVRANDDDKAFPGLPVSIAPGRNAFVQQIPSHDSTELLSQLWDTVAHEIGHAFGLGDEYAEHRAVIPDLVFTGVNISPNLMGADDVQDPTNRPTVEIDRIKWNWHRIQKANVLTLPVEPMFDETFRVFVNKLHGTQFNEGDPVRLRRRERLVVIGGAPETSFVEFTVKAVAPNNLSDAQDQTNMTIVLHNDSPIVPVDRFIPGSIIYMPVVAPATVTPPRSYLTLVSPLAERIMAATGGTFSGKVCNPTDDARIMAQVEAPVLPTGEPDKYGPMNALPRVVGAYFGGQGYSCGVLHPCGSCFMGHTFNSYAHFCPVCQYVLVEQVDPEQHPRIDQDLEKFYTL